MATAAEKRVSASVEPTPEDKDRIGTLGGVFPAPPDPTELPEIEIDPLYDPTASNGPRPIGGPEPIRTVVIRVNQDIEDMSWVGDGRRENYTFQAGGRYRVPTYIAIELERLGKVWH